MIRFLALVFLLSQSLHAACAKMSMPTDYALVTNGTRANLKANFSETQNKFNPCADSVDEVRGRFSGYSSTLLITSLENMRLKLDGDATTTAKFLIESSNGDSLFRVSEDTTARFFRHVTIDSNLTLGKYLAFSTNGATGSGRIYKTAANGLEIRGVTGSSNDLGVFNNSGSTVMTVAAGTTQARFLGAVSADLTLSVTGVSSFTDTTRHTNGLKLGSSGDVNLYRSASNMLKTDDSLAVAGSATVDTLISTKFYKEGSFTGTLTGVTTTVTGTLKWVRIGKIVTLFIPLLNGTSNSTACTITGLPAEITPVTTTAVAVDGVDDNGSDYAGLVGVRNNSILELFRRTSLTAFATTTFTNSGTKGIQINTITYSLQ